VVTGSVFRFAGSGYISEAVSSLSQLLSSSSREEFLSSCSTSEVSIGDRHGKCTCVINDCKCEIVINELTIRASSQVA
jgi:hypothetical protein